MPAALEEALLVLQRVEPPPEGRFRALRDQLTQLDRGRTESPARIKIAVAIFFIARLRALFLLLRNFF